MRLRELGLFSLRGKGIFNFYQELSDRSTSTSTLVAERSRSTTSTSTSTSTSTLTLTLTLTLTSTLICLPGISIKRTNHRKYFPARIFGYCWGFFYPANLPADPPRNIDVPETQSLRLY